MLYRLYFLPSIGLYFRIYINRRINTLKCEIVLYIYGIFAGDEQITATRQTHTILFLISPFWSVCRSQGIFVQNNAGRPWYVSAIGRVWSVSFSWNCFVCSGLRSPCCNTIVNRTENYVESFISCCDRQLIHGWFCEEFCRHLNSWPCCFHI